MIHTLSDICYTYDMIWYDIICIICPEEGGVITQMCQAVVEEEEEEDMEFDLFGWGRWTIWSFTDPKKWCLLQNFRKFQVKLWLVYIYFES